jgi:transglutaminase superfamily protein
MTAPLPFTVHAALPCQPHAGFAASLAAELGAFDDAALQRGLAALELPVAGLAALGHPVRAGALRVRDDGELDDLLIDRVVTHGVGHEAVVAVVLCELGRRAGMPVGVVGAGGRHLVGHEHVTPWLLDPATGEVFDARTLGHEPEWRCGHQVADTLLDEVELRCERAGDLTRAIRAAQLRCALPFDDEASERAGLRLRRLRSRLN